MTRYVENPASAEQQPKSSSAKPELGSQPALVALVRLMARQVAAELINSTFPLDQSGSLKSPPTSESQVSAKQKDIKP